MASDTTIQSPRNAGAARRDAGALMQQRRQLLSQLGRIERELIAMGAIAQRSATTRAERRAALPRRREE